MVADEVVHYYMLVTQADKLPGPNVDSNIPMFDHVFHRKYPHVFLWHYLGAIVWRFFGKSFYIVQFYHSLFWLQLLIAFWFLSLDTMKQRPWAAVLSLVLLASLPMAQLFAVLLFQDVPAVAQIVTAFLFLRRRKITWSAIFMGLGLDIKITVFVLLPVYLAYLLIFLYKKKHWLKVFLHLLQAIFTISLLCAPMAGGLRKLEFDYYPLAASKQYMNQLKKSLSKRDKSLQVFEREIKHESVKESGYATMLERPEIAAHPGDLRTRVNWVIYFGGIFWAVVILGVCGLFCRVFLRTNAEQKVEHWPLWVATLSLGIIAYHLRSSPDARFFLPGLPFLILGIAELAWQMPLKRVWFPALLLIAVIQSGAVAATTASLRRLNPDLVEAFDFFKIENSEKHAYLMYPEGHERFLPGYTDWYMGRELHDFWRAGNDQRIEMLAKYKMRYIVIKKYKIRDVSPDTHDISVYPKAFVEDVARDPRFETIFENGAIVIYRVSDA